MKIAISSKGPDITSPLELGSTEPNYWIIYDTADHSYEVLDRFDNNDSSVQCAKDNYLQTVDIVISGKRISEPGMDDPHFEIGHFPATKMSVEDVAQMIVQEKSRERDQKQIPRQRRKSEPFTGRGN